MQHLISALISYPAGTLSDRFGRRSVLLAAYLAFFLAYLGFALTNTIPVTAALFVLYGLFQGIFRAVGKALAADFVPEALRASSIGWYSTTVGLLQLVASVVSGLLWDHVSHSSVFLFGAVFAILGSVALILLVPGTAAARGSS
jgi:MFS family permease